MKINITYEDLVELAKIAKKNGTQDNFIDLAIEWAEAASVEIERLKKHLKKHIDLITS